MHRRCRAGVAFHSHGYSNLCNATAALSLATPHLSIANRGQTKPLQIVSVPCHSKAEHHNSMAALRFSLQLHCSASQKIAMPIRCGSGHVYATPCIDFPLPFHSKPSFSAAGQILAPPLLFFSVRGVSLQCRRPASPCSASPLLIKALPSGTCLSHCSATGRCRKISRSPATRERPFRDRHRGKPP